MDFIQRPKSLAEMVLDHLRNGIVLGAAVDT
jgi:hypothetical protein